MITLHKNVTSILQLYCPLNLPVLVKQAAMAETFSLQGTGQPLADSQVGTEVFGLTAHKELNPDTNYMNLEAEPSPVGPQMRPQP